MDESDDNTIYEVKGVYIYDPRIDKHIISDNPALIFGDLVRRNEVNTKYNKVEEKKFWKWIAEWADYCDQTVDALD